MADNKEFPIPFDQLSLTRPRALDLYDGIQSDFMQSGDAKQYLDEWSGLQADLHRQSIPVPDLDTAVAIYTRFRIVGKDTPPGEAAAAGWNHALAQDAVLKPLDIAAELRVAFLPEQPAELPTSHRSLSVAPYTALSSFKPLYERFAGDPPDPAGLAEVVSQYLLAPLEAGIPISPIEQTFGEQFKTLFKKSEY